MTLSVPNLRCAAAMWTAGWDTEHMADILSVPEHDIYASINEVKRVARDLVARKQIVRVKGREFRP